MKNRNIVPVTSSFCLVQPSESKISQFEKHVFFNLVLNLVGRKNVLGFAAFTPPNLAKLFPALQHLQIRIWFPQKKKKIFFGSRLSSMQPEFDS